MIDHWYIRWIGRKCNKERDNYLTLAESNSSYATYTLKIIPIVIGATGLINKILKSMLKRIGVENNFFLKWRKMHYLENWKLLRVLWKYDWLLKFLLSNCQNSWDSWEWHHWKQKWSFPLRISSVNVTKSTVYCGFDHIYWRNPQLKTWFFLQCTDHHRPP